MIITIDEFLEILSHLDGDTEIQELYGEIMREVPKEDREKEFCDSCEFGEFLINL